MSIFFVNSFLVNVFALIVPGKWFKRNSEYYSYAVEGPFTPMAAAEHPHLIIQIPVYKETFRDVIQPTLKNALRTCERYTQSTGKEAYVYVNDDGLAAGLDDSEREERISYYESQERGGILRYISRPAEGRRGKFKKAGNLNYALAHVEGWKDAIILILDSDSRLPEAGVETVIREFAADPTLGFIQMQTGAMKSSDTVWDNIIRHFTDNIYSVSFVIVTAYGDPSPLVGHNVFLRGSALAEDGPEFFSEEHVSEDFEVSMRMQLRGYKGRYVTYLRGFEEGVTVSPWDEIVRLRKYAYGVSELVVQPVGQWLEKGIVGDTFKKYLIGSEISLAAKWNVIGYMGTYYALAASPILVMVHYFGYAYCPYWKMMIITGENILYGCIAVFSIFTPIAITIMKYKLGLRASVAKEWLYSLIFSVFFAGLGWHMMVSIIGHLFGWKMSWGATNKNGAAKVPARAVLRAAWQPILWSTAQIGILVAGWQWLTIRDWQAIVPMGCSAVAHLALITWCVVAR